MFGKVFRQHNTRFFLPECPLIHYLSNQDHYENGKRYIPSASYHTDHSNDLTPPKATVLLATQLPESGGDTQSVNMTQAYEDLPLDIKKRIEGRKAKHVYQSKFSVRKLTGLTPEAKKHIPEFVMHPLIRTHPETVRKTLYVNPIRIEAIEGLEEAESLQLLDALIDHATQTKYQYRHQWRLNDLVM